MRNPDKRRFLDAARHIETQEIPLFEIGPDMALARQILGKDLPMDLLVYELPIPDYIELNRRDLPCRWPIERLTLRPPDQIAGWMRRTDGSHDHPAAHELRQEILR